jgi:hypothetical protein
MHAKDAIMVTKFRNTKTQTNKEEEKNVGKCFMIEKSIDK